MRTIEEQLASDIAYRDLKRAIISLELQPGQVLRGKQLRERYGIGRTPSREALQRLSIDGLVRIVPRQGTYVSEVRLGEVKQILELRECLEPFVAELAASRCTEEDIEDLRRIMKRSCENDEPSYELDLELHARVARAARNEHAARTLALLHVQTIRMFRVARSTRQSPEEVRQEHEKLVDALSRHDSSAARKHINEHLRHASEHLLGALLRPQ